MLAIAAWGEDSNSMAVDGDEANNDALESGAVYMFRNTMGTWAQEAYIKASNTDENDLFGTSLALNHAGDRLAVGALGEDSSSADNSLSNDLEDAGAVYIFNYTGSAWMQDALIKAAFPDARDEFGFSVAFDAAGDSLAVSAPQEDSSSREVGGDQENNASQNTGAAYLFQFDGSDWTQDEYFKADNADPIDELGFSVALNSSGDKLVATSLRESSSSLGINGSGELDFVLDSGAGYLYVLDSGDWSQKSFIKSPLNSSQALYGWDASFAEDGDRLAISSFNTSSVFIH